MKRFLIKLSLFSLPFQAVVGFILYAGLVLPMDYFTFRAWEALSVYEKNSVLSGPFYPNMHLVKTELGDQSGLTKYQVPKEVEWFTDRFGYRKKEANREFYEIVIIGDSSTAGSGLTQKETIANVLEEKLGVSVYPYAPSDFNKFLDEERFKKNPPKVVIVETVEKLALSLPEIPPAEQKKKPQAKIRPSFLANLAIMNDRLKKGTAINYLRARLGEIPRYLKEPTFKVRPPGKVEVKNPSKGVRSEMVFYSEPEDYFVNWKETDIKRVIFTLKQYRDELKKTGTKLVFMPIPNKENLYWRQVKGGRYVENLKRLIDAAHGAEIATVDLWSIYNALSNNNPDKLLYHTDDSHWNSYGVEVAANELAKKLNGID